MSLPVASTLVAAMAAAGCSRTALDAPCPDLFGKHPQPSCTPATADPPTNLLPGATALAVRSAQCDVVAIVTDEPGPPELRVSLDGGTSFGPPRPLTTDALLPSVYRPRFEPLAMAEDGTLYVLAKSAGALRLYRSDDFGESWGEPVEVPGSNAPWGASLVGALLHWVSEMGSGGIAVLDTDGGFLSAAPNPDLDGDGAYDLPISSCPCRAACANSATSASLSWAG